MTLTSKTLYYTPNSPYARIIRVAARQSGLIDQIDEVEARTRSHDTWYFDVTPLARVPLLVDGACMIADTRDICAHFDTLSGTNQILPPETAQSQLYRQIATGFLDGIAVWMREARRPAGQKSQPVILYEAERARKALAWLEQHWASPANTTFTALTVACTLDIAADRGFDQDWDTVAPTLRTWATQQALTAPMQATRPQPL